MRPRSGFGYRGTSECTLVPVFVTKGSCGETVVQKGVFLESAFLLCPLKAFF